MNPLDGMPLTQSALAQLEGPYTVAVNSSEDTSYAHLSFLTLQATAQTMIVCLFGYFAARRGWLTKSGQKTISNLNVQLFTPCLIFSKMGSSLSLSALPDLAVIPLLFVLTTGVSLMCGRLVSRILHFNRSEGNFVTAMAVFGNSNSLPVSLTVSLAQTLPFLRWPDIPNDNADGVTSRGLLYLLIFQQLGQMVRWSWGYHTLLAKPMEVQAQERLDASLSPESPSSTPLYLPASSNAQSTVPSGAVTPLPEENARGFFQAILHQIWVFMNPPLWSMLAALIVASIEPLKNAIFIDQDSVAHQTLGAAIQKVGSIAIPLILIVLGSNLAPTTDQAPKSPRFREIVIASLLSRIALPAVILLPLLALCVKYCNISIMDDPIFLVSSFILTVSPPAIQLAQITQLNGVFEAEMAGVLFWGYVVITPPSSVLIVVLALQVLKWTGITQ